MKSNILIPKKINVGFQKRGGTYTGKLAYVIYFDEKGKLRKEKSWDNWRDKGIENIICENEPTSGFVLNKKAGGYSTGWNHRQTYVRVYDPRGFEFEISVPNLLYILENATSTKGKGLEGEFVYGWDGTELILMPVESPDYKEISSFNNLLHNKEQLKGKDLVIGGTYLTNENKEVIYMGRFDKWDYSANKDKHYFFFNTDGTSLTIVKSLTKKIIHTVSSECVENYADLFDKLEKNTSYSPIDNTKDEFLPYTFEEFKTHINEQTYGLNVYTNSLDKDNKKVNIGIERWKSEHKGEHFLRTEEKYMYEYSSGYGYHRQTVREPRTRNKYEYFKNLEELFNLIQPIYKNTYLANGKLHKEGKSGYVY